MASSSNTIAIIIALEQYQGQRLTGVDFAKNDANAFKNILLEQFQVPEANIHTYSDENATFTTLSSDIPYFLSQTPPGGAVYLYYAGHGWYIDGSNRLSTFDSRLENISTTTISVQDHILAPLQKTDCSRALLFFDCCAEIPKGTNSRAALANMDESEFREFVSSNDAIAAFFACRPGQQSFPSKQLCHGIWSFHLFQALRGNKKDAMERAGVITGSSLQNYLAQAVPQYITQKTQIRALQNPWAEIKEAGSFDVLTFQEEVIELSAFESSIAIRYEDVEFAHYASTKAVHLSGFIKGTHTKPTYSCPTVIAKWSAEDIKEDLRLVYDKAKSILNIRSKFINKSVGSDGGNVDCEFFRYYLEVQQGEPDFDTVYFSRRIEPRDNFFSRIDDIDGIFPVEFDNIVFPIDGTIDHAEIVDKLEAICEVTNGSVKEDDYEGIIEYSDNTIAFTICNGRLSVKTGTCSIQSMIKRLLSSSSILIGARKMLNKH